MAQSFFLAVDVGTSRVGAATARLAPDGSIVATPFALGRRSDSVATVAFVTDDGELLFGDAAERRGVTQPERLVREFKRSIGDDVPLVVGGQAIRAEYLYARTVADVVATVAEREGGLPEGVILTHPAMWGPHRIGVVAAALESVGVGNVQFMTEPEAAARHYESSRALDEGETLAVYDLGGGTFDCVILRKTGESFQPLGRPVGLDNLGGADFDDAVLRHVLRSAEVPAEVLQDASPDARIALSQLRRECVDAKEALSFDSDVVIPVLVTAGRSSVRLTRGEFEAMIDTAVAQTIDALQDALESAGVAPDELESILLIGGSSRIPLVAQRLSEELDRPIAVDADPKSSIALGAARTALIQATDQALGVPGELAIFEGLGAVALVDGTDAAAVASGPAAPVGPATAAPRATLGHIAALSGGAILVAAAIVFGSTLTAGSGGLSFFSSPSTPTATPTPEATAPATSQQAPVEAAEEQAQPKTDSGAAPRSGARKGAASAPITRASDTTPTTRPSKAPQPVTAAPNPSTSPKPGGTTTAPTPTPTGGGTGTGTTDPGSGTTTDPGTGTTDPGTGTTDPGTGTTDPGTGTTDPGTGTTDPGTGTTDPGTGTTDPGTGTTDPTPTPTPTETQAPPPPAPDPSPTPGTDIPA
jgi:hypothetical protein